MNRWILPLLPCFRAPNIMIARKTLHWSVFKTCPAARPGACVRSALRGTAASLFALIMLGTLFAACASNPKGSAKIRADKGSPAKVKYVTAAELEKNLRSKGGEDIEIDVKMLPKGGRIYYESSRLTVSYSEQENTNPYLSVVEGGKEVKFCDESDFESKNLDAQATSNGAGVLVPLKSNKAEMQCDLQRQPSGEFEVHLLDSDKRIIEKYFVTPAQAN